MNRMKLHLGVTRWNIETFRHMNVQEVNNLIDIQAESLVL